MCGINGIFAYHYAANQIDLEELVRTRDHMAARGPDGKGEWISNDRRVGFGHRRLSIIDLSDAGRQPMSNADGSLVVTFNGEIYNYQELRRGLEAKGYQFRSNSDTEVLLHLYGAKGEAMVHDLRGMFAFAIWDARSGDLFLARDPYGIKPLYYADDGWTFRFASQVKALMAGGMISGDVDPAGAVGFYLWGSVPEPYTTKLAIRALPAGSMMRVGRIGARQPKRYHSIAQAFCKAEVASQASDVGRSRGEEARELFREAMLSSVRHHLVADVPVGVFLSAGIDSGALVGLMRDVGHRDTRSVSITFEEFRGSEHDEGALAAEVARLYGTRHTEYVVTRGEFENDLHSILKAMDQPSIDGLNTWFVSKAAAALGLKVAISGVGGDELLGGYPSFADVPRWVRRLALPSRVPGSGPALRHGVALLERLGLRTHPKLAGLLELGGSYPGAYLLRRGLYLPWEIDPLLAPDIVREGLRRLGAFGGAELALEPSPSKPFGKVATLEAQVYMRNQLLRDTDWASMAHSVEVRTPYVDATLLAAVAPLVLSGALAGGKAALGAAPRTPLPAAITRRRKTGFSTPIADWQKRSTGLGLPPRVRSAPSAGINHPGLPWARRWALHVAHSQGM